MEGTIAKLKGLFISNPFTDFISPASNLKRKKSKQVEPGRSHPNNSVVTLTLCLILFTLLIPSARAQQNQITIRMMGGSAYGIPPKEATSPRSIARRAVFEEFHRENPNIRVVNAGGLQLAGDDAESAFLMSMAGDTAPDVFMVNFRQYYKFIDEGFCLPLDPFINQDPGQLKRINPIILKVLRSYDGHIYAMPWFQVAQALYYRKDFFRMAGLDPNKPPRTWAEFYKDGQALSMIRPGLYAFAFYADPGDAAYWWINFLWQAGGDAVIPTPSGIWKADIATPAGVKALQFYRKLVKDTWKGPDGKTYGPVATINANVGDMENNDQLAMWFEYTNDLALSESTVDPSKLGIAAMPAGPAGQQNEINAGMFAINATIKDPAKIAACWKFIKFFSGPTAARIMTQKFVEMGMANMVNPVDLKAYGYESLLGEVDPNYVKANENLFKTGHPEPYGRNCEQVYAVMGDALDRARLENTPAMTILKDVQAEMDSKLLGYTPPDVLRRRQDWAAGICVFLAIFAMAASWLGVKWAKMHPAEDVPERLPAGVSRKWVRLFVGGCVFPASLLIFVWSYLPLGRGLVIAFQSYHIIKGSHWVGLDNFIQVFTRPSFIQALGNTILYVVLTIAIGFLLPMFLALALDEIPKGRVFFRVLYYLPAMTSSMVIALLWREIYDKSENGLLNQILLPIIHGLNVPLGWMHIAPILPTHDWLGDPRLALFSVVLPGIWAAAGPGSILYLAALKNVPQERYEAADIDGAGWWQKIIRVTMPALKPLILINLLGVFIGSFKAFDNIFVMTGGGPLGHTNTLGLEIWKSAFMYLEFGYATAAAWVMGAILVGFTLVQVKTLLAMRFTSSGAPAN